jgi:hypothetical protein
LENFDDDDDNNNDEESNVGEIKFYLYAFAGMIKKKPRMKK